MYCTVLYCTVLYCTVRRSDVTPGGVKWIHSEYYKKLENLQTDRDQALREQIIQKQAGGQDFRGPLWG